MGGLGNPSSFDYFNSKRTDRIYVSREIPTKRWKRESEKLVQIIRKIRYASKMIVTKEIHQFIKEKNELKLRISSGGKQEIIAKFYEDTRGIYTLQIQKYTIESGNPHQTYFSFSGDEIGKIFDFIRNIPNIPISSASSFKIDDKDLEKLILSKEQAIKIFSENQDVFIEVLKNDLTKTDVINLGYKKEQLKKFESLLYDSSYLILEKDRLGKTRDEDVWQLFFEENTWIFGYGLEYIFNTPLEGKKLEQVTKGWDFNSSGKRVDALLKTSGIIQALCFAEIKTHKTKLLGSEYRPSCYLQSKELAGGIAQIQKTIQKSLENLGSKVEIMDENHNPTDEKLFLYQPNSFLIIGCLDEFKTELGINTEKYSSFELLRKNLSSPKIITFDELFERAKYIVEHIK